VSKLLQDYPLIERFDPAREDIFGIEKPTEGSVSLQTNKLNVSVLELAAK